MMNSTENELLFHLNNRKIKEYAPAIAFSAIIVVFGILGNAVSLAFYGFKVPRTTTNILITVLAIVDLVTCIVLSDEIVELCFTLTFMNVGGCKAMYFFNHSLVLTSGYMLFFVAFDRFRKICRPFSWQISVFVVKVSFLVIVLFAVAFSVRDWIIVDVVSVDVVDSTTNATIKAFYCTHTRESGLRKVVQLFQVIDLLTLIVVMGGTLLLYAFISKRLWESRKHISSGSQRDASTTSTDRNENQGTGTPDRIQSNKEPSLTHDETMTKSSPECDLKNKTKEGNTDNNKLNDGELKETHIDGDFANPEFGNIEKEIERTAEDDDVYKDKTCHRYQTTKKCPVRCTDRRSVAKKRRGIHYAERKVTLMMLTVTAVSLLSFVPYFIVSLWTKQKGGSSAQEFNAGIQIALRSYMLNNAVNPYIMGFFNSKFRVYVKSLLCSCRIFRLK